MARPAPSRPTDAELAILSVLWAQGPSTVRTVCDALGRERQDRVVGYTTILKLLQIMHEKGLVTRDELERLAGGAFPLAAPSAPGRTNAVDAPRFRVGDRVVVRNEHFAGHIRMPAYIRGKRGVVVGESPPYPFPDAHAHGVAADDEPTYDVRFATSELWPNAADDAFVHVGVFRSYLLPAP